MKKRIVVICPGRGTYNNSELGYIKKHHGYDHPWLKSYDEYRRSLNIETVCDIDNAKTYNFKLHVPGENSADLIHACSYLDFLKINRNKFEIVAITGNSMGWYLALACGGYLKNENAYKIVNTMGSQMKNGLIGGQIIYPWVGDDWCFSSDKRKLVLDFIDQTNSIANLEAHLSIDFGGYAVIGGNDEGLKWLLQNLPKPETNDAQRFPFQIPGNAAFHTSLLNSTSEHAKGLLTKELFEKGDFPIIDGRGKIYNPWSVDTQDLWDYTLGHQVTRTYDFTTAIKVSLKEFCPDHLVITGPGTTLGGAVAQSCIFENWNMMTSKDSFVDIQKSDPFILSMGIEAQRELVVS